MAMDYYIHEVHQGIAAYARMAGWMLDARAHHLHLETLPPGWTADGIITYIASSDRLGPALRASGMPIVNMSPWRADLNMATVNLDNRAAGVMAAEHLLSRGFQHLTMLQFHPWSPTSRDRREGFEATVAAAGRRYHPAVSPNPDHAGSGMQLKWVRDIITKLPHPLGVFTEGDLWAVEVIHLCKQVGLAVPDQVGVLGVDNDTLVVDLAPVAVSSVDNDLRGLGYRAAELLDDILSGAPPPTGPVMVPPIGVVQRQSTDILAVPDEDLARAVRFIHDHFAEPIMLDDVAEQTATSRRRLQDLFTTHLGRTINDEIRRCRLDLAKRLLRETSLKVSLVAERAGFGTGVQMAKVFTRHEGFSPAHYRQRHSVR